MSTNMVERVSECLFSYSVLVRFPVQGWLVVLPLFYISPQEKNIGRHCFSSVCDKKYKYYILGLLCTQI